MPAGKFLSVTGREWFCTGQEMRRMDDCAYGKWTCDDGREVLFNRFYEPIWQRLPDGVVLPADRKEWVKWNKQEWFYDVGTKELQKFKKGMKALIAWGLPEPSKRYSQSTIKRRIFVR